jgi:hypothetical protein
MQETTRGRQSRKGQSSLQGSKDVGLRGRRLVDRAVGARVGFIGKREVD